MPRPLKPKNRPASPKPSPASIKSSRKTLCGFAGLGEKDARCNELIALVEELLPWYARLKNETVTHGQLLAELDPLVKVTKRLQKDFLSLSNLSQLLLDSAGGAPGGLAEIDAALAALQIRLDAVRTDLNKKPQPRRDTAARDIVALLLGKVFDNHKGTAANKKNRINFIDHALCAAGIPHPNPI